MKAKLILPALTEAKSPFWRPIKYSLFPPLGLATLAGYFREGDDVEIVDEHVESLAWDDTPELVAIETYVTNSRRAWEIADHYRRKGAHVIVGGLHATACPHEGLAHADTVVLGPGEDAWRQFLADFRLGATRRMYTSTERTLCGVPPARRDLIKRHLYLVPNSLVVSRGCPHSCDFCYKDAFFAGGKSFYTTRVETALHEIQSLPGKHLFFLDDNLFADPHFAAELFDGMKGLGRVWQAAATVRSLASPELVKKAADAGCASLFIGFETLSDANLKRHAKGHNLGRAYEDTIARLRDHGIMVNGSFVFGMDDDDESVFDRTVEWAVSQGIETATFHILTPYPGTALHNRMKATGRLLHEDWPLYDTRHTVFKPARMTPEALERGYWNAYRRFYGWKNIFAGAMTKTSWPERARHLAYAGGWKKCEPLWDLVIRLKRVAMMKPLLERLLSSGTQAEVTRRAAPRSLEAARPFAQAPSR